MNKRALLIAAMIILSTPLIIYSQEDKSLYYQGVKSARQGDENTAFMCFRQILNDFPESKFTESALFVVGEYYFSLADYYDAAHTFSRFIRDYPGAKARPFALTYLIKIAARGKRGDLVKSLEKEVIASQQLSLLFRDFKEYTFVSPSSKKYKAVYFIDKIEFFIDEELFAQISY